MTDLHNITQVEAAQRLGISYSRLMELIRSNLIRFIIVKQTRLFSPKEIQRTKIELNKDK